MSNAKNVLTTSINYRVVHGGVAAVESVYCNFHLQFNHVAAMMDYVPARKFQTFFTFYIQFLKKLSFHKEIRNVKALIVMLSCTSFVQYKVAC